jgi:UDP-N-acetylmuramate--alanine ligase
VNEKSLPDELMRVHMVGIGGAGSRASPASCSTAVAWFRVRTPRNRAVWWRLRARGASIRIGHDESSLDLLPGGPTAVVTTHAAIPKTNPELVEARRRGIPVILRPVVLGQADGRPHHADGHRHPRQDHHHVDAHCGVAAQRV